jgi:hypothetical protein
MATVNQAMTTTNVLSDQLAIDLGDSIHLLEPSVQPLAVFSRMADKRRTVATKFSWLEDASKARFDTQSGGATATATTVNVTNGAYFEIWDQVLNTRTGEQFRVTVTPAANALTVVRAIQGDFINGTAMLNGDELYIIGSAQPEGDRSRTARSDVPSKVTNNTQIFRCPIEQTGSLQASGFQVSPGEWPRQQKMKAIEHAKDIELAFLLGRKSAQTPAGFNEDRTTGGVLSFISTNQTDAGGDLSEAEFNAFMLQVNRYPAAQKSKLALASGVGVSALNKFPASKQQTQNNEKTYGMSVTHYTSPFGALNLVWHPLLEGTKYGGYIIVVDMDQVAYRYLANDQVSRDTKLLPNRQDPDRDGIKSEYLTEAGLEFGLQRTHGVLTGITS